MQVQGFNLIVLIFSNDTTLIYRHLDHFPGLSKFIQKNLFYQQTKTVACTSPVVLSDLCKGSSPRKVGFSASSKCLRIWARFFLWLAMPYINWGCVHLYRFKSCPIPLLMMIDTLKKHIYQILSHPDRKEKSYSTENKSRQSRYHNQELI
jgi:hypothetical protein